MSGFTRIVHFMASLLASSSSARLNTGWAFEVEVNQGVEQGVHARSVDEVDPVLRVEGVRAAAAAQAGL